MKTKIDYIDNYNKLSNVVKTVIDRYELITGKEHEYSSTKNHKMTLSDADKYYKNEIKHSVEWRKNIIDKVNEDIQSFLELKKLEATEEGLIFINGLKKKNDELHMKLDEIKKKVNEEFNKMLQNIGINDWCTFQTIDIDNGYSYFPIGRNGKYWNTIDIGIERMKNGEWKVVIKRSASSFYTSIACKENDEYHKSKAYFMLFDKSDEIIKWANTIYADLINENNQTKEEIDRTMWEFEHPVEAWKDFNKGEQSL